MYVKLPHTDSDRVRRKKAHTLYKHEVFFFLSRPNPEWRRGNVRGEKKKEVPRGESEELTWLSADIKTIDHSNAHLALCIRCVCSGVFTLSLCNKSPLIEDVRLSTLYKSNVPPHPTPHTPHTLTLHPCHLFISIEYFFLKLLGLFWCLKEV